MTTYRTDRLHLLLELAADSGHQLCLHCLADDTSPAGTLLAPLRHAHNLTPGAAAAVQLLTQEIRSGFLRRSSSFTHAQVLRRVLVFCRVTLALLPAVAQDCDGRFSLSPSLDDDGTVPARPAPYDLVCNAYAERLTAHLREHDRDDWVDPNVIAGDVANMLDFIIQSLTWHELFDPTYSTIEAHGAPTRGKRE